MTRGRRAAPAPAGPSVLARARAAGALAIGLTIALAGLLGAAGVRAQAARDAVPAPSYAGWFHRLPCVDRIGRCFDATIGGQPVEVIAEQAEFERLRALLHTLQPRLREVYWQVRAPVAGHAALEIQAVANALGEPHVGVPREEPDVTVYALDGQDLDSETETVARQDVRVNGQPVLTQQDTLTQDFLPPGRYALAIKYLGTRNWDRKLVFLTVR